MFLGFRVGCVGGRWWWWSRVWGTVEVREVSSVLLEFNEKIVVLDTVISGGIWRVLV